MTHSSGYKRKTYHSPPSSGRGWGRGFLLQVNIHFGSSHDPTARLFHITYIHIASVQEVVPLEIEAIFRHIPCQPSIQKAVRAVTMQHSCRIFIAAHAMLKTIVYT